MDHPDRESARREAVAQASFDTRAVRAGSIRSELGEHSEALYLSSSFVCDSAAQAAARFVGEEEGYIYSRAGNPSVSMFEQRVASLEGAEACVATASGMSAIAGIAMSLARSGEHVVASKSLFGATVQLFANILPRFGITTTFVSQTDLAEWEAAIRPETKMLFLETPSNPLLEVADIEALSKLAKRRGIPLVVDNCLCTPALQRPLSLGADVVVHSATKYLDGQGRVLGGAICGPQQLIEDTRIMLRTLGPTMSPFNAWVILRGMETLKLRMQAQSASALALARWLEAHPAVERVCYPGLESHLQHALAARQQSAGGAIVTFVLKGDATLAGEALDAELRRRAWHVIDSTQLVSITANLGDTRTTITHPASTTHGRLKPEARAAAGVGQGLIRIAVGLEDVEDIKADLQRGLGG